MRIDRLQRAAREAGLDALVAVSPENFFYATGAYILTQKLIRDRLAMAVIPASGEPTVIVCSIEESLTRAETPLRDVRTYVEFRESPVAALAAVLTEKGLDGQRVGIELRYLSMHYGDELRRAMPGTRFEDCGRVFHRVRAVKEPGEIELLARAARGVTGAIMAAFGEADPGDSERRVAAGILRRFLDEGLDEPFLVLGTGARSAQAHPIPSERYVLRDGDVLRVDGGGLYRGYYGDVARTVFVGRPDARRVDVFKRLAEVQRRVVERCTVGTPVRELYELCRASFAELGLPFHMPHIGHSMGVELHEEPMIQPLNDTPIEENMVLNIEPIAVVDGAGYHIEDLVLVTARGPQVLNRPALDDEPFFIA